MKNQIMSKLRKARIVVLTFLTQLWYLKDNTYLGSSKELDENYFDSVKSLIQNHFMGIQNQQKRTKLD